MLTKINSLLQNDQFHDITPSIITATINNNTFDIPASHINKIYIFNITSIFRPFLRSINDLAKVISLSGRDDIELVLVWLEQKILQHGTNMSKTFSMHFQNFQLCILV
jgi:hypothetical protein